MRSSGKARQLIGEAIGKLRERMAGHGEELTQVTFNFWAYWIFSTDARS